MFVFMWRILFGWQFFSKPIPNSFFRAKEEAAKKKLTMPFFCFTERAFITSI